MRAVAIVLLALGVGLAILWEPQSTVPGATVDAEVASLSDTVTYHGEVAEILEARCIVCHRSGGSAPFSLEDYPLASRYRNRIAEAVESGQMPLWLADPRVGQWSNARRLSDRERSVILRWVEGGAREGARRDRRPSAQWPRWSLGEPDAVVSVPTPVYVPAAGVMSYQYHFATTDFGEDMWIRGFEVSPSSPEVVHHVLVFLEEPEYPGQILTSSVVKEGFQIGRDGWFAAYVPGYSAVTFPQGTAKRLPAGASLKFQIHYTPRGEAAVDKTSIGLYFASEPPAFVVETGAAMARDFIIPPGHENYEVTAVHRFDEPVTLIALSPHMHLRGKSFRFDLHRPDGRTERLLDVPRWDFNVQDEYWFEQPLEVPAGASIRATGWYDNSRKNPLNPDPRQVVRYGEQTFDEMMNGYFHYIVRNPDVGPQVASRP